MFTASDVASFLLIGTAWLGAGLFGLLLLYARVEYGPRKARTIGAILIDTLLSIMGLLIFLGAVPLIRIFGYLQGPQGTVVARFANIGAIAVVVWIGVARMLVWALRGDGGQTLREQRRVAEGGDGR